MTLDDDVHLLTACIAGLVLYLNLHFAVITTNTRAEFVTDGFLLGSGTAWIICRKRSWLNLKALVVVISAELVIMQNQNRKETVLN